MGDRYRYLLLPNSKRSAIDDSSNETLIFINTAVRTTVCSVRLHYGDEKTHQLMLLTDTTAVPRILKHKQRKRAVWENCSLLNATAGNADSEVTTVYVGVPVFK